MYGKKYVWFVPHWYENQFWNKVSGSTDCQPEHIHAVISYALSIQVSFMNYNHAATISGMVSNEF